MTKKKVLKAIEMMVLLLEKGITTNCMARTKTNIICDPMDLDATKWCPMGAAKKASGRNQRLYGTLLRIVTDFINMSIGYWNDDDSTSDTEVILAISMTGIAYEEGLIQNETTCI